MRFSGQRAEFHCHRESALCVFYTRRCLSFCAVGGVSDRRDLRRSLHARPTCLTCRSRPIVKAAAERRASSLCTSHQIIA